MVKWIFLILSLTVISRPGVAANPYSFYYSGSSRGGDLGFEFQGEYVDYQDARSDGATSGERVRLGPSTGVSLGVRIHSIFMMSVVSKQNSDLQRKTVGLAVKAYVPGFFLIGGSLQSLIRNVTKDHFLTYGAFEVGNTSIFSKEDQAKISFIEFTAKLGFELGHVWGFYTHAYVGATNYLGNYDLSTGAGIGVHF